MNQDKNHSKPTLLIAEEHRFTLAMVEGLLEYDFDIVGNVDNGRNVVEAAALLTPDIIILDVSLAPLEALGAALHLKTQRCAAKVIFLSECGNHDHVVACMAAGGDAYVCKERIGTDLRHAIQEVLAGKLFFNVRPNRPSMLN